MHFKKIVYVITTAIAVFACLGSGAKAKPMQEIFDDIAVKDPGMQVCAHIEKLKKYIHDKAPEPGSSWFQLDPISKIKRKDSVIFGLFCCFCYKKNWANHVRFAAERRTMFERNEDIDVIMSIFPMCIEGPEGLTALCRKLEINIDDITMAEDDRSRLIDFIKATPTYETRTEKVELFKPQVKAAAEKTESPADYTDDTEEEEGVGDKSVNRVSPKEIVIPVERAESTEKTLLSPKSRRKHKKTELKPSGTTVVDTPEVKTFFKSRRKRNKPNCLGNRRKGERKRFSDDEY